MKEEDGGVGGGVGIRWPECFQGGGAFLQEEQVGARWLKSVSFACVDLDENGPSTAGAGQGEQLTFCLLARGKA